MKKFEEDAEIKGQWDHLVEKKKVKEEDDVVSQLISLEIQKCTIIRLQLNRFLETIVAPILESKKKVVELSEEEKENKVEMEMEQKLSGLGEIALLDKYRTARVSFELYMNEMYWPHWPPCLFINECLCTRK